MVNRLIAESDEFVGMPLSTQALYFHLAINANEEGLVNNPKAIKRAIRAKDDDLNILLDKEFVDKTENGVHINE